MRTPFNPEASGSDWTSLVRPTRTFALLSLIAIPAPTQGITHWVARAPATVPPARQFHGMAYDTNRQVVVLFGGWTGPANLRDTWEFNGVDWVARTPQGVPPLTGDYRKFVYDSARSRIVMVIPELGDTWEYDGASWVRRVTPIGVPYAPYSAIAYDGYRQRVVLFGGVFNGALSATWEYDGNDWTVLSPSGTPPGRYSHAMAYDNLRQRVVMFGGWNGTTAFSDTWEYDGTSWLQRVTATTPSPRSSHAMTYDSARGKVLMFGGDPLPLSDRIWEYDGLNWIRPNGGNPPARRLHPLAYDSTRGKAVLFGGDSGSNRLSDTWEYDVDSDGDGLPDDWELNGIPYIDANNVAQRYVLDDDGNNTSDADPLKKDLFVEVDAAQGHAPRQVAIDRVKAAFAATTQGSPPRVPAPAGVTGGQPGITLHVLIDETTLPISGDYPNGLADFYTDKALYFGTPAERQNQAQLAAKAKAYRYCMYSNRVGGPTSTTSGQAEIGGNDFIVSLGGWTNQSVQSMEDVEAGTFMHELGHTLGLRHGGGQEDASSHRFNYKPHYFSVMNYMWQLPNGWLPSGSGPTSWSAHFPNFSDESLPLLRETQLMEAQGVGFPGYGPAGIRVPYSFPVGAMNCDRPGTVCTVPGTQGCLRLARPSGPADWNGDCNPTAGVVQVDINRIGQNNTASLDDLEGHDDWEHIHCDFKTSPYLANGAFPSTALLELDETAFLNMAGPIAAHTIFGAGCPGGFGVTTVAPSGDPLPGNSLTLDLMPLPQAYAFLVFGFDATTSMLGQLPKELSMFGMPGCQLYVSIDVPVLLIGTGTSATYSFMIPNDQSLLGLRLYEQALVPDAGAGNAASAVVSDALVMTVGT